MLKWSHQRPNLIQPQAIHILALCKFVLWLVKETHFCDGSHQSEVDFTQHKHRNSLWLHLILVLVAPPPHVRSPFYMGNSAFVSWTFNQIKKKLLFWGRLPFGFVREGHGVTVVHPLSCPSRSSSDHLRPHLMTTYHQWRPLVNNYDYIWLIFTR